MPSRARAFFLAAACLVASGCAPQPPTSEPDIVYAVTAAGSSEVWVRYLKDIEPGGGAGKRRGVEAQENARTPFTRTARLGQGWTHAWIEATTEPVDRTVKLHCALQHNGTTVTEGNGLGFVSCGSPADGNAAPPA
ncbi:hypothetical protein Srot_0486 [Segniliparus rotundus DSM 44985]|uniref:Lipoprotein n=1 Tax=Segniliparus rotundus (strain ATCC BAA-972 / CDC 1076 / CIP 108378 / DSM 44985 / JCM 13578) TaxID=640132 RepID=D6ZBZ6_SEGRD|nr:hypothetical protein [Segniliparus rotundus]ADG96973.1 hypothetical protein Srot_0486 [Segniliparus rotundus DSM 44985]